MKLELATLTFSLLVVRPRKPFFEWLDNLARRRGCKIESIYFAEEDGVWIIPALGTFDCSVAADEYIASLKPVIIKRELGRFGLTAEEIPGPWTVELCDKLFDLEIRDTACLAPEKANGR